jgi:hypothetical protein
MLLGVVAWTLSLQGPNENQAIDTQVNIEKVCFEIWQVHPGSQSMQITAECWINRPNSISQQTKECLRQQALVAVRNKKYHVFLLATRETFSLCAIPSVRYSNILQIESIEMCGPPSCIFVSTFEVRKWNMRNLPTGLRVPPFCMLACPNTRRSPGRAFYLGPLVKSRRPLNGRHGDSTEASATAGHTATVILFHRYFFPPYHHY